MDECLKFYKEKKVFITGHTGFKGAWLCKILLEAGASVTGFALDPPTSPSLFELAKLDKEINSIKGDIRDLKALRTAFRDASPQIVFHLAAQPIVREGYIRPVYTYETNVIGTVNLLECVRESILDRSTPVGSIVNVTTDKVYLNREWSWGYRENEELNGYDPYSNSKSCSELVTECYRRSFFTDSQRGMHPAISTARAGNVIGGGDFAKDRIIPDCVRAAIGGEDISVRNPQSIRPYQHVLEPLSAYLLVAEKQYEDAAYSGAYNVGPDESDNITTGELVESFCHLWGNGLHWKNLGEENAPHEAGRLRLDCSYIKNTLGWKPQWGINMALEKTVEWTKAYLNGMDVSSCMTSQIMEYFGR